MIRVQVLDVAGNKGTIQFPDSATKALVDGFLADYSLCGVQSGVKVEEQTITETMAELGSNVDHAVKCLFVFGQEKIQFSSLSPKETGIVKKNLGRVLTVAEKSLMLADWKTVEGKSEAYTLRRNRFLQHK